MQCCAVIDGTLRPQLLPMLLVELDVFSCTDAVTAPRAGDASFASWRAACRDQAPEGVPATEAFPVSPVCQEGWRCCHCHSDHSTESLGF